MCLGAFYIKFKHMKKNINLNLEEDVYQAVRRTVPKGQVSSLVNNFFKEHLKKIKEQELKEAYQRTAKSKAMREDDKV